MLFCNAQIPNPSFVGRAPYMCGAALEADWAKETRFWKQSGASHLCLTTTFSRRHHKRIPGHTMGDHLAALRRYHSAVADQV